MLRVLIGSLYRFVLYPGVLVYWRLLQPKTYGARIVVRHPGSGLILLVRHVYGRRDLWYPPGGGVKRGVEDAAEAVCRETREEVGLEPQDVVYLGQLQDDRYGNRNTIYFFAGIAEHMEVMLCPEIAESRWVTRADCAAMPNLSVHTRRALDLLDQAESGAQVQQPTCGHE